MVQTMAQDMRENIAEVLKAAQSGSKPVSFTFHKTSILDIAYLLLMNRNGIVKLKPADVATLQCVQMDKSWGSDRNRTLEVEMTETFDPKWFSDRMARACESIVIA